LYCNEAAETYRVAQGGLFYEAGRGVDVDLIHAMPLVPEISGTRISKFN